MSTDNKTNFKELFLGNPFKIYGWSFVLLVLSLAVAAIIKEIGMVSNPDLNPGIVVIYFIFLFLSSIITSIAYRAWFKKYWPVNALVFVITGVPILLLYLLLSSHNVC